MILFAWAALLICAAIWTAIGLRVLRIRRAALLLDPSPTSASVLPETLRPLVSVIVPARNEARDLPQTLRSLRAQDHAELEIIVVDDESEDGTAAAARAALAGHARAQVLAGAPRPDAAWVGKTWALTQGVTRAQGEWLLFTDADVELHPSALRLALAEAQTRNLDVVTILPALECRTVHDHLVLPLFALLAGLVASLGHDGANSAQNARLSGAFILIRASVYRAVGGHAAVREQLVEDLALARRLRSRGYTVGLRYTRHLVRTRMYDGWHELRQGMIRFAYPVLGFSRMRLIGALAAAFFGAMAPVWAVCTGAMAWWTAGASAAVPLIVTGAGLWILPCLILGEVSRLVGTRRAWWLGLPISAAVWAWAAAESARRFHAGRPIEWKGRSYSVSRHVSSSSPRRATVRPLRRRSGRDGHPAA